MSFRALPPDRECQVIDLASRREPESGVPDIPEHVLDEIDAAALRCERLAAEDQQVRFETDPATGRVVASLCDLAGGVVRALPLREVVCGDDDPQSAA